MHGYKQNPPQRHKAACSLFISLAILSKHEDNTEDVIEMRVMQPPTDPSAAQTLAREQFLYCSDIVQQAVGTTRALASMLQGGTAWYFWWD